MADSTLPAISIDSYSAFLGLRSCAGNCLLFQGALSAYGPDLVSYIGCEKGRYNTCYCNSGIATQASSFVSSCVSQTCSEVADVSSAVQAWGGYCSDAGYPLGNLAVTTAETLTSKTATQPTTLVATVPATVAPIATATNSGLISSFQTSALTFGATASSSSSPGSNAQSTLTSASSVPAQSNTGAIAGGVVGGVAVLGIIAIIITMLFLRDRRRGRREKLAANAVWQPPAPSELTIEKMVKTPVMASSAPVVSPTHVAPSPPVARALPRTLDGESPLAGTGAELDSRMRLGNELDGRGGCALRGDINEMQG
jgi:hypothetical protein